MPTPSSSVIKLFLPVSSLKPSLLLLTRMSLARASFNDTNSPECGFLNPSMSKMDFCVTEEIRPSFTASGIVIVSPVVTFLNTLFNMTIPLPIASFNVMSSPLSPFEIDWISSPSKMPTLIASSTVNWPLRVGDVIKPSRSIKLKSQTSLSVIGRTINWRLLASMKVNFSFVSGLM